MSTPLPLVDLTGASVGTQKSLDFSQFVKVNPMYPDSIKAHLGLFNESGCGLQLTMQASGRGQYLPAGAWTNIEVERNDGAIAINVIYTLPNPPVSMLNVVYYAPGEGIPDSYTLGNSPIGIGGTVQTSSVQSLSNEGNAINTLVFDAGPTGNANVIQIFNDHFVWSVVQGGVAHTVLQGQTTGNPLLLGKAGDISEVLGQLTVDQAVSLLTTLAVTGITTLTGNLVANGGINLGTLRDNTTGASQATLATAGITIQNLLTLLAGLTVTGNVNTSGAYQIAGFGVMGAGANLHLTAPTGGQIIFDVTGGVGVNFIDGTGLTANNGVNFNIGRIKDINTGTVAATGTVNHGLSGTPAAVLLCPSSNPSTWTFGASGYTSTQFSVQLTSALTTRWLAYR